ncbi:hypothetical protein [Curtobacterium sp. VKM Ac-2887]|nr:hypothetical protein [Curtobacterium sp. VKM Ac-2887]MBF4588393.1 hypothetical protein [Curtobacterium sp. VKM Ac-2887]
MLDQVRHVEAALASYWIGPVTQNRSMLWGDTFLLHLSDTQIIAFRITVECTIVILAAPIMFLSAALIGFTRVSPLRWLLATLVGVVTVVVVNQLRLGLIAWSTLTWGLDPGYEISHTFVGSALAVLGFAGAIALMLVIMSGGSTDARPRAAVRSGRRRAKR